eukprot:11015-Eustigmatos_ZCMA.PRE.1
MSVNGEQLDHSASDPCLRQYRGCRDAETELLPEGEGRQQRQYQRQRYTRTQRQMHIETATQPET